MIGNLKIINNIKKITLLRLMISFIGLPFSCIFGGIGLIKNIFYIKKADVVILLYEYPSFGHSIHDPDISRRIFKGKSIFFIMFERLKSINPIVSKIWPDIKVFFFSINEIHIGSYCLTLPSHKFCKKLIAKLVKIFCKIIGGAHLEIFYMTDVFKKMLANRELIESVPAPFNISKSSYAYFLGYPELLRNRPVKNLRLPDNLYNKVVQHLEKNLVETAFKNSKGYCCLYLRYERTTDLSCEMRNGSTLNKYLPAVGVLIDAGYHVLLTGDRVLDKKTFSDFKGRFTAANNININKNVFDLFAATEADIFIGECGGGMFPSLINGIPGLLVNVFPYLYGLPGWSQYFKTVRNKSNNLVPYPKLFYDYCHVLKFEKFTVYNNNSSEILYAVECFLNDLHNKRSGNPQEEILNLFPEYSWFKQSKARVSPAWLNLYRGNSS